MSIPLPPAHSRCWSGSTFSYRYLTPERGREDHAAVRGGHVGDVSAIVAHTKTGILSILAHPGVGLLGVLEVGDNERLVSVDGAPVAATCTTHPVVLHLPVLGAHHVGVHVESIDLAAPSVTAVPVASTSTAGVEGGSDGVLVALHDVVLGAPDVVAQIGVTVVITITGIIPGHVDEVGSCIAVAANIAHVQGVGEMLVHERSLPVHVGVPAIVSTVAKVKPGVTVHGEPIVVHLQHEDVKGTHIKHHYEPE